MRWSSLAIWAAVLSCGGVQPAPDPTDPCEAMCATGERLHCDFADTTPGGVSCVAMCITTERTGYTTMHPLCVAQATSCADADRRSQYGCQ